MDEFFRPLKSILSIGEVADLLNRSEEYVRLLVMDGKIKPIGSQIYGKTAAHVNNLSFDRKEVIELYTKHIKADRDIQDQMAYLVKVVNLIMLSLDELRDICNEPDYVDFRWITEKLGIHRTTLQNRLMRIGESGYLQIKGLNRSVPCQMIEGRWKVNRKALEKILDESIKVLTIKSRSIINR